MAGFPLASQVLREVCSAAELWRVPYPCSRFALNVLRKANVGIDALVSVVEADPILALRILKLVNSGGRAEGEVASIAQAVLCLGPVVTKTLVLSMVQAFDVRAACLRFPTKEHGDVRSYSLAVGVACREVARRRIASHAGAAYAAGLLHAYGILMLHGTFGGAYRSVIEDCPPHAPLDAHERVCIGVDHVEVGLAVLERLGAPTSLLEAIANAHRASPAAARAEAPAERLTRVLRVGIACGSAIVGDGGADRVGVACEAASRELAMSGDEVREVLADASSRFASAVRYCATAPRQPQRLPAEAVAPHPSRAVVASLA